mgnify:CR=1 FL=1
MRMEAIYRLLTELASHKTVSRLTAALAKSRLSKPLIPHFVNLYAIRAEEAEKPLEAYQSLNEFFTRRLKTGSRPFDEREQILISPVDARITALGDIREGRRMMIKGQEYAVDELLNHSPRSVNYRKGKFIVLYLSPSDYHRIHAPVDGTIIEKDYIPGRVYPVNAFGLTHMRKVLSRNERAVTYLLHAWGELAVIKVGALNVSGIRYADSLGGTVRKGDELAVFEFGSTVVLLMESGTFEFHPALKAEDCVLMGQTLGELHPKRKPPV